MIFLTGKLLAITKVAVLFPTEGPASSTVCVIQQAALENQQIDLKIYNSGNSLLGVLESVERAINEKVNYIIGPRTSQEALALLERTQKTNITTIVPMSSHPAITEKFSNAIRLIPSSRFYSKEMAKLIKETSETKKLFIVNNASLQYSEEYTHLMKENLKHSRIKIIQIDFVSGENITAKISKILSENHSVSVYLPLYSADVLPIVEKLSEGKKPISIFTHGGTLDGVDQFVKLTSRKPNIVMFINHLSSGEIQGPYANQFYKVAKHCKTSPNEFRTMIGFDAYKLLEQRLLKSNDSFNFNFHGVMGIYKFDEFRNTIRPFYVMRIERGSKKLYEP